METIFTYERRNSKTSISYNVFCADLLIGALSQNRKTETETEFEFILLPAGAKIVLFA